MQGGRGLSKICCEDSEPHDLQIWRSFSDLPLEIQALARKNFLLWKDNAAHPSLHVKRIGSPNWSVRVGQNYRAVGKFSGELFLWEWIGTHEEYNKRY
jgi:hypothetical protein